MNLVIFANFFPYKKAEPFLVNEFEFSKKHSDKIELFTLYGKSSDSQLKSDEKVISLTPVLASHLSKNKLFVKGLFNLSPFKYHLKDVFIVLFSIQKLYWFLVSLLVTRTILASQAYKQLLSSLSKTEKTVLYFYWGDNLCWIIPYLRDKLKSKNVKIVLRLHGSDLYEHLKGDYAPLRATILKNCDLIVTISENGKRYLSERYPDIQTKIMVSRLGVFDNGINPFKQSNTFTVVSVSNAVALKRLALIFEVLQKVKLELNWYHFGDGPLLEELKSLAKQSRMGLKINLMGHVNNKELIQFYKTESVDLFVNLSTTEGLPVSIMEALSFGIPVLAPDIGGIGELVNVSVGQLIPVNYNSTEIADELTKLITSEKIVDLRKNARLTFEERLSANKNYTQFYDSLKAL